MAHPGSTVAKVGGSLLADGARLRTVLARLVETGATAIVPGGGPFADAVRAAQAVLGFDDALAHRLALDAMGRTAEILAALEPRLTIAGSLDALERALAVGRSAIWDPAALKAGHPDIPETWHVTSDSLALWLATQLRAARCVLVKSAACPTGASPGALARAGLVDRTFPAFARRFDGEIAVFGPDADGPTAGSRQRPSSHTRPHPEVPERIFEAADAARRDEGEAGTDRHSRCSGSVAA